MEVCQVCRRKERRGSSLARSSGVVTPEAYHPKAKPPGAKIPAAGILGQCGPPHAAMISVFTRANATNQHTLTDTPNQTLCWYASRPMRDRTWGTAWGSG